MIHSLLLSLLMRVEVEYYTGETTIALFGIHQKSTPVFLSGVMCSGSETNLLLCPHGNQEAIANITTYFKTIQPGYINPCPTNRDVGVRCRVGELDMLVQRIGESERNRGRESKRERGRERERERERERKREKERKTERERERERKRKRESERERKRERK